MIHLISIAFIIYTVSSTCDNYWQSSSVSSTKRPFDLCYHSEVDSDLQQSSYRYICNESDYGVNHTVDGYTAFRQDFDAIDCEGEPISTSIIHKPYGIHCGSECEILKLREYDIINITACTYNTSVYQDDIQVIAICDYDGTTSDAIFCSASSENAYYWSNSYYGGTCDSAKIYEATYQFSGCQGDGSTYIEVLQCDISSEEVVKVEPFDDSVFVAGFVLLLVAILFIIFVLIWYCCWYRKGYLGAKKVKNDHAHDHDHHKTSGMGTTSTGGMR